MAKRLAFRTAAEDFLGFDWSEINREGHFLKHGIDFPIVGQLDWSRIKKAVDRRGRQREVRTVALANCPLLGCVLVVVYSKVNRIGRIISVRRANEEETEIFHA
jgi:uncharacterized DUF497 family protein